MSARHGDWELVGRSKDPVPGDPYEVGVEARHYDDVAATIRSQAYRLRRMSESDDDLKGSYADGLKDGMRDLADDLDKIYGRFAVAVAQLTILEPALETARIQTKVALDTAAEEQRAEDEKAKDPNHEPPESSPFEKSEGEKACERAMEAFDSVAESVAGKIRAAADDDMKDSRWDKFKGFVKSISGMLNVIVKIITVIVVIVAIAALFVTGLGPLMAALLIASLAINTLLATTDNGSWTSVAFDVLGLATLGLGTGAVAVARMGRAATLARAARPEARAARTQAFQRAAWNGGRGARGFASRVRPSVISARHTAYDKAVAEVVSTPMTKLPSGLGNLREGFRQTTIRDALKAGSAETREFSDDLARIASNYPGVASTIRHSGSIVVSQGAAHVGNAGTAVGAFKTFTGL